MNLNPDSAPVQTTSRAVAGASFRVPGLTRDIQVTIATQHGEFAGANALLAAGDRARGDDGPADRFAPDHALPGTVTLVAKHDERIVATLSLVPDTPALGLPMERSYGPEVARLRHEGRRMAEAIRLADAGLSIREFVRVFKALIGLAIAYHGGRGGDTWLITIDPRHRRFCQRVLGFASLGPPRSCPTAQDHPAEAYRLDLESLEANAPPMDREDSGTSCPRRP
jgi:hypothetical protein